MTEDEARTKWCPFVRAIQGHKNVGLVAAGNRDCYGEPDQSHRCIASDCMAWRQEFGDGRCGLAGE